MTDLGLKHVKVKLPDGNLVPFQGFFTTDAEELLTVCIQRCIAEDFGPGAILTNDQGEELVLPVITMGTCLEVSLERNSTTA